jgi:hypothetical protein
LSTQPGKGTEIRVYIPYQGQVESHENPPLIG